MMREQEAGMNGKAQNFIDLKELIEYHVPNNHPDYDMGMEAIKNLEQRVLELENLNESMTRRCDRCARTYKHKGDQSGSPS